MKDWTATRWIVLFAPAALLAAALLLGWVFRGTFRSRRRIEVALRADPDIHDWLVVFGWSRKVLYTPTVVASLLAAAVTWIDPDGFGGSVVGGIWTAVFLVNFLIDEYEISVRVLSTAAVLGLCAALWLLTLDWLDDALRLLGSLKVSINATGYLLLAGLFLSAILISYVRGLFSYTAFTPNYMNLQIGMTETGEQIAREEYSTRVDTGDFLERMLGFGWIIITFSDPHRPPLRLLVGDVGAKAAKLESIRGKIAIDD